MSGPKAIAVAAPSVLPVLIIGGATVVAASVVAIAAITVTAAAVSAAASAVNATAEAVDSVIEKIKINKLKNDINEKYNQIKYFASNMQIYRFEKINIFKNNIDTFERLMSSLDRSYSSSCYFNNSKELESCLLELNNNLQSFEQLQNKNKVNIFELRDSFARKAKALENSKNEIASSYSLCNIMVDKAKINVLKNKLSALADIKIPDFIDFDFERFDINKIIYYQNQMNEVEKVIKNAGSSALTLVKSLDKDSINELINNVKTNKDQDFIKQSSEILKKEIKIDHITLDKKSIDFLKNIQTAKYSTIEDFINEKKNNMKPDEKEKKVLDKATELLSKFSEYCDSKQYKDLLTRFDNIKNEEFSQRRSLLYDDFVIACDKLLKEDMRRTKILNELKAVKRQLIYLNTPNAAELVKEFDAVEKSRDISKFEYLKNKAITAVQNDINDLNNKKIGEVMRDAFQEMGYETDEEFETLMIKNKKIHIHKPAMKNYQVQLLSSPDTGSLQMEVVRVVDNESELTESTRSHAVRDVEIETEFCEDYKKILRKLEDKGIKINEKMHKKPGEVKVKKVLSSKICRKTSGNKVEKTIERK